MAGGGWCVRIFVQIQGVLEQESAEKERLKGVLGQGKTAACSLMDDAQRLATQANRLLFMATRQCDRLGVGVSASAVMA